MKRRPKLKHIIPKLRRNAKQKPKPKPKPKVNLVLKPKSHYPAGTPAVVKNEFVLPFTPPVLFYRSPRDLTHGIVETLAEMPEASVGIDPLVGEDWTDFINVCRARGRHVYGWTRVSNRAVWDAYRTAAFGVLDGHFPNIEDDDLRGDRSLPTYVVETRGTNWLLGVLTNYNVSDEWPNPNPLGGLCVLPEWFPSEIRDGSATLEGSLDTGRKHFAAAMPLLDGREERGLAAFSYAAGAFCVWPADNVSDWSKWRRA